MIPACPPLGCAHSVNSFLDGVGAHIGDFLMHPQMMHVASTHMHLAPVLVVPVLSCAAVPIGVWASKRRRHLRLCLRGLVSARAWRERARWHHRLSDVKIGPHPMPKPMSAWPTRSGVTMLLKMTGGTNMTLLEKPDWSHAITADLACMGISFKRIHRDRSLCLVNIVRRDSLAKAFPWPWLDRLTTDFLGPIPVAVDINGAVVTLDLREKNMLVAGIMGSGKSWFLHLLVAAAMGDKRVHVHMLDGKMGTGFRVWKPGCASFATDDTPKEAIRIVEMLNAKLNKFFGEMQDRSIDWDTAKSVHLLIVDEYTAFLGIPGFEKTLNELIRRGRAGGVIVVLATQRPSSKVMDTDLSRLIEYRLALLCADSDSSKMALGTRKADASELSGLNPGEGFLFHEGRTLVQCRAYGLTDADLATLAARAIRLRRKDDAPQETVPTETRNVPVAPEDDSPPTARSPKANLSVVRAPAEPVSVAPGETVVPAGAVPAVPKALRPTLVCIALHGPQTASGVIQTEMGIPASTQRYRCQQLERLGLVSCARQVQSGRGGGGRDPLMWSLTPLGTAALTHKPAREKEDAR
jgi:DNA segregation ATPase FtsK/SpoIIIE, S-DNA-T family